MPGIRISSSAGNTTVVPCQYLVVDPTVLSPVSPPARQKPATREEREESAEGVGMVVPPDEEDGGEE